MLDFFSSLSDRPGRPLSSVLHDAAQTLVQVVFILLILLGLGGLMVKAFGREGWVESTFSYFWNAHPVYAVFGVIALAASSVWFKRGFEHLPMFGKRGDLLVYACLSLGLFFAVKLLVSGTL